jgi:hypothetical protein
VLGAVVPMTSWWRDKGGASMLRQFDKARTQIDDGIDAIRRAAMFWFSENEAERDEAPAIMHAQETRISLHGPGRLPLVGERINRRTRCAFRRFNP